ncbi:hypothetical protein [Streptomyces sp. Caat 7-52]|uniref:hypothetical protein n=1 Tax=Streptomyces sp. Caat 7-52 TaxID=2949637 RepID=UPI002035B41F|nr:hypothetical protein [Streptomyces sp. Caat 7-52]
MSSRKDAPAPEIGVLAPGTEQRDRLRSRFSDIAWTSLCAVLAVWAVLESIGSARESARWVYCGVAWVLLAVALATRVAAVRRRARSVPGGR